nr:unnamed protein product [Digitaria exilis]
MWLRASRLLLQLGSLLACSMARPLAAHLGEAVRIDPRRARVTQQRNDHRNEAAGAFVGAAACPPRWRRGGRQSSVFEQQTAEW